MTTTETSGAGNLDRQRGGRGRYVRSTETAERDAQACRLRVEGWTYDEIAQQVGFTGRGTAKKAVERALMAIVAEPAGQLRTIELARLDIATKKAFEVLGREHVTVSNGRLIMDPATGKPLRDDGPTLAAIDRIVRLGERRARLLGLDAAVKVEAVTIDAVEAEINRLVAEMDVNDATETQR